MFERENLLINNLVVTKVLVLNPAGSFFETFFDTKPYQNPDMSLWTPQNPEIWASGPPKTRNLGLPRPKKPKSGPPDPSKPHI